MSRKNISTNVERMLYAESMGRCMNPNCQRELFIKTGDIMEKAHIVSYSDTNDNSFENLIVLCPNCHKEYDKTFSFSLDELKNWKQIRKGELAKLFSKKFETFDELKKEVVPLLLENKTIHDNYYLNNKKELWDKFESKVLINNRKLKELFEANLGLFQRHNNEQFSNLEYIYLFMLHVDEFESTRLDEEKIREVLYPPEIDSMFGISPVIENIIPSTESLELLITKLNEQGKFECIYLGDDFPYIKLKGDEAYNKIYLCDAPRLRQFYYDYDCFTKTKVRFESLNYALKYMNHKKVKFEFVNYNNLRKIIVNDIKIIFIYEYCLSKLQLRQMLPEENSVIVNLHNWNGTGCISKDAYEEAEKMNITLLTMSDYYEYVDMLKNY